MSQYRVPEWNLRQQRQEQVEDEGKIDGRQRSSSHVHINRNPSDHVPMSNHHEVAELSLENGKLSMHGLGAIFNPAPLKPTWPQPVDTLESIVNRGLTPLNVVLPENNRNLEIPSPPFAGKSWAESSSGQVKTTPAFAKKRTRPDCDQYLSNGVIEEDISRCGSATFSRENDTTMMTWTSFESPRSSRTKIDGDSTSQGGTHVKQDEQHTTKEETVRSHSKRPSRAAAIHNQSERRRRDKINQKMKELQKLVPNASKTDKASMLDGVIEYLKQLQAQIQFMSIRNMPQMMVPLVVQQQQQQQQLQMSLLARMGAMGVGLRMGIGMLDMSAMSRTSPQHSLPPLLPPVNVGHVATPPFMPPQFLYPSLISTRNQSLANCDTTRISLDDPYNLLAQSMNIEIHNKMAALYRQQINEASLATSSPSKSSHAQAE